AKASCTPERVVQLLRITSAATMMALRPQLVAASGGAPARNLRAATAASAEGGEAPPTEVIVCRIQDRRRLSSHARLEIGDSRRIDAPGRGQILRCQFFQSPVVDHRLDDLV